VSALCWRVERRRPEAVSEVLAASLWLRIAAEGRPSVGDEVRALIGPWADELDPRLAPHRRALCFAMGHLAFFPDPDTAGGKTPVHRWGRARPRPPARLRSDANAVAVTPPSLWRVVHRLGEGWVLEDLVGLHPRRSPTGTVSVGPVGRVELCEVGCLFARVVNSPKGPVAVLPLGMREAPPPELVRHWVIRAAEPVIDVCHQATVDTVLRRAGHDVCRSAFEWSWLRGPTAVSPES
jgi:hypothetical protein